MFLIGESFLWKGKDKLTIISQNISDNKIIVEVDNKKKYDLVVCITAKSITFDNPVVQEKVLDFVKNLKTVKISPPKTSNESPNNDMENIIRLLQNKGTKKNITNMASVISDKGYLQKLRTYGRTAREIYLACCYEYGFDRRLAHHFAKQQILFAAKASPERYAMWMLPHNNLTGTSNGTWVNIATGDGDTICEYWLEDDSGSVNDKRLAFLKQGDGEYVFFGVYELEKREVINFDYRNILIRIKKTYKRVSDTYPELQLKN